MPTPSRPISRTPEGGKVPQFVLVVDVLQAFMHCSKSSVRAGLWQPERWPDASAVPPLAEAIISHCGLQAAVPEVQSHLEHDEKEHLY